MTRQWDGRTIGPRIGTDMAAQTDYQLRYTETVRNKPWTKEQLEKVRQAAQTLVRTHESIDKPNGQTVTAVDGAAFWALLGALDRSD